MLKTVVVSKAKVSTEIPAAPAEVSVVKKKAVSSEVSIVKKKRCSTPPPPQDTPAPFEDSFSSKPIAITPRPAGVAKPTINPVASGNFALDKIKKKNGSLINELSQTGS